MQWLGPPSADWCRARISSINARTLARARRARVQCGASNANNRILDGTISPRATTAPYRAGDWRKLPSTITVEGRTFETAYGNVEAVGADNGGMMQEMDSKLFVVQSYFLDGRLVTTFGYRKESSRPAAWIL